MDTRAEVVKTVKTVVRTGLGASLASRFFGTYQRIVILSTLLSISVISTRAKKVRESVRESLLLEDSEAPFHVCRPDQVLESQTLLYACAPKGGGTRAIYAMNMLANLSESDWYKRNFLEERAEERAKFDPFHEIGQKTRLLASHYFHLRTLIGLLTYEHGATIIVPLRPTKELVLSALARHFCAARKRSIEDAIKSCNMSASNVWQMCANLREEGRIVQELLRSYESFADLTSTMRRSNTSICFTRMDTANVILDELLNQKRLRLGHVNSASEHMSIHIKDGSRAVPLIDFLASEWPSVVQRLRILSSGRQGYENLVDIVHQSNSIYCSKRCS